MQILVDSGDLVMPNNAAGSKLAPTRKYQSCSDSKCVEKGKEVNDPAESRSGRTLPVRRLDAWKARRSHFHSVDYADMTPLRSHPQARYKSLTRGVHCQTAYSFPVDFDLGLFFDSPLFLYLTDESDVTILNSAKADVSISSTELRQQLYSHGNSVSTKAGCGEASKDSISSDQSDERSSSEDESSPTMDYVYQHVSLSALPTDINDVSLEASPIIDADIDNDTVRRSSWSSEEYYNLEEHMSRDGLRVSPIAMVEENANDWNQSDDERCSDTDWVDCLPSTSQLNEHPPNVGFAQCHSSTEARKAANAINSFTFVSTVEKALEEMKLQCTS
ncbi:hypothetical protein D918_04222 [Trichuris suis]|nr:hypothetical protein D918_04222 [Trichuris suis]